MRKLLCFILVIMALSLPSISVLASGPWINPGTDDEIVLSSGPWPIPGTDTN